MADLEIFVVVEGKEKGFTNLLKNDLTVVVGASFTAAEVALTILKSIGENNIAGLEFFGHELSLKIMPNAMRFQSLAITGRKNGVYIAFHELNTSYKLGTLYRLDWFSAWNKLFNPLLIDWIGINGDLIESQKMGFGARVKYY